MKKKLESLIKLLDDENSQIAQAAMSELLKHEDDIAEWLAQHQESENSLLRQRIHQLQSIITVRRRRRDFSKMLEDEDLSLLDGLVAVHLQWYDNDSERSIIKYWKQLLDAATRYNPENLEKLAYFMRKCGFSVAPEKEVQPDYFCLGPVLEDQLGADFILCAIALEIAAIWNLELKIARCMGKFVLVDGDGRILTPHNSWQLVQQHKTQIFDFWSRKQILKLASSMLFLFAVSSDSFRYVHTIGHTLASIADKKDLDFLPYPYNSDQEE